jgi:predicted AAA+ superfamily ATPase
VKASARIRPDHLKGLRELSSEHPETARRVVVSLDEHDRTSEDGIEILHWRRFLDVLWSGALF